MGWSWSIGRPFGIDVRVHITLVVLLALMALSDAAGGGIAAGVEVLLVALVAFSSVALHELGHALAARAFGIGTRRVTLLPIGGVAEIERPPRNPAEEIVIALAGPAVNFVLAGPLLAGGLLLASPLLFTLGAINLGLGVFNLLPAFPMDGGRVMRGVLARYLGHLRATHFAARVGQGFAVLLGIAGLLGFGATLVFIAVFVAFAAESELRMARLRAMMEASAPPIFGPGGPLPGGPFWRAFRFEVPPSCSPPPSPGAGWRVVSPEEPEAPRKVRAYLEEIAPGVYALRKD